MSKAALVVMAAGLGSRFGGGIKQLEPVGPKGEIIMEYSIYDALAAGFDKVVFVIRHDLEQMFKQVIGDRIATVVDVEYAYQELQDIPEEYKKCLEGREKPWGTGQAILCCRNVIASPFLVINADDFYGKQAYIEAYRYLTEEKGKNSHLCMVGFILKNTLSENGSVTRGVCRVSADGMLEEIVETRGIEMGADGGAVIHNAQEDVRIAGDTPVSMNMWGIQPGFFAVLEKGFSEFLENLGSENGRKEYLLPTIIGDLLKKDAIEVRVLQSHDRWFGVTYKEDKASVVKSIQELIAAGEYPEELF